MAANPVISSPLMRIALLSPLWFQASHSTFHTTLQMVKLRPREKALLKVTVTQPCLAPEERRGREGGHLP